MEKYLHYGQTVVVRPYAPETSQKEYRNILIAKGIEFSELPYVDLEILKYDTEDGVRYAIPNERRQKIYVTKAIPDDCDWEALMKDVDCQSEGEKPTKIETRLRKILLQIEGIMYEDKFTGIPDEPDYKEVANYLMISYGINKDRIKSMNRYDIDEDYFNHVFEYLR